MAYWVKFKDNAHPAGCVADYAGGINSPEKAMAKAQEVTGCEAISAQVLPYGSGPVIWAPPKAQWGFFCLHPEVCCGKTSCPRAYACSE